MNRDVPIHTDAPQQKESLAQQIVRMRQDIWKYIRVGLPAAAIEEAIEEYQALGEQAGQGGNAALLSLVHDGADRLRSELASRERAYTPPEVDEEPSLYEDDPNDASFLPPDHTYHLDAAHVYDDPRLFFLKPYLERIRFIDSYHFGSHKGEKASDEMTLKKILDLTPTQIQDIEYGYTIYQEMCNPTTETFTDLEGVTHTISSKTSAAEMYKWSHFAIWPDIAVVLKMYPELSKKKEFSDHRVVGSQEVADIILPSSGEEGLVQAFDRLEQLPQQIIARLEAGESPHKLEQLVEQLRRDIKYARGTSKGREIADIAQVKLEKIERMM